MPAVLVKRSMKLFRMTSCKLLQREEKIRVHLHLVIILTVSLDVKHHVYLFSLDRKQSQGLTYVALLFCRPQSPGVM